MSNIYHTEPPTQGKVLIKTNYGDIDIELWAKEAPLACRNFIQLALEGMYDNTIAHRIIKGFMVQMGDPSGTGNGGESIWGKHFKDEIHGRIKFNHRGQVAMANENRPHTNKAQFFITLDNCEWLNGKHTIFGKVTGSTMFNVLRMGEVEVGENDLPLEPIKILTVEVLWNPFDDIVPRDMSHRSNRAVEAKEVKPPKPERKAVRNANLLSFGGAEDEDGEESEVVIGKIHSSHDSKFKDRKLSSKVAVRLDEPEERPEERDDPSLDKEENFDKQMKRQILKHRMREEQQKEREQQAGQPSSGGAGGRAEEGEDLDEAAMRQLVYRGREQEEARAKSQEFSKLKADLLRSRRAVSVLTGAEAEALQRETSFREMISPLEQRRAKYMKRKSAHGSRSDETLAKLQRFTAGLRAAQESAPRETAPTETAAGGAAEGEHYHGQVTQVDSDEEGGEEQLADWHLGKLKFKKHIDDRYRLNPALEENYSVFDPRASH